MAFGDGPEDVVDGVSTSVKDTASQTDEEEEEGTTYWNYTTMHCTQILLIWYVLASIV